MQCLYKIVLVLAASVGLGACDKPEKKNSSEGASLQNLCDSAKADLCRELETLLEQTHSTSEVALNAGNLIGAIKDQIEMDRIRGHLELFQRGIDQGDSHHAEIDNTHAIMLSYTVDDPMRSFDESTACIDREDLCFRLRSDLHTMQNDYYQLLSRHSEQFLVDRRAELNYRLALLTNYAQKVDPTVIDQLDDANRLVSGIVDRLTIGNGIGYILAARECAAELKKACSELETQLASVRSRLRNASNEQNEEKVIELSLQLNFILEILALHQDGVPTNDPKIEAVTARYERLRSLVSANRPPYRAEETLEVRKVTEKYGDLFITEQDWQTLEVTSHKPWAGYWYPFRHNEMFSDENSPLQKFDAVLATYGRSRGAASWEREKQAEGPWESSDGMCDAWSAAASMTVEPTRTIRFRGVTFEPKHIKGLLVQKYARLAKERFGFPYQGRIATDGLSQDLRPEAFHLLVKNMLANNEIPTVDTDPDFEMWNKPLYKYEWRVTKDEEVQNAYIVDAKAYYVKWRNVPSNDTTNYTPGRDSDLSIPQYRYRLVVNPSSVDSSGAAQVIYGEWLVDDLHPEYPDTLFRISPEQAVTPRNPFIASNLDILDELLSQ